MMDATLTGTIVFLLTFFAAKLGMQMRTLLPKHHLDVESKETIKLAIGLIATMTALILGLVTASAKSAYDAVDTAVKHTAVEVLVLDRLLARYGPDSEAIRSGLKETIGARIKLIWPTVATGVMAKAHTRELSTTSAETLADSIRHLRANDDSQRAIKIRAEDYAEKLMETRWFALSSSETTIPIPFMVALVFWLVVIFWSFGLFSPRNSTVLAVLAVCTLSVGSTIFLILEMGTPFGGVLTIAPDPFIYAYEHIGK